MGTYMDLSVQSIFNEACAQNARDPHTFHIISNAGTTSKCAEYNVIYSYSIVNLFLYIIVTVLYAY